MTASGSAGRPGWPRDDRPAFAHASEAELARILDFYDVRWEYEPDTFPIGWNLDGDVVESFSPDFYLPDLELYVELTTLKQKLVRKKNRKLRRLRELYPGIRIKLFYARDFRALLLKFGRLALAPELSGSSGQAAVPRSVAVASIDGMVEAGRPALGLVELPAVEVGGGPSADPGLSGVGSIRRRGRRRRRREPVPTVVGQAASAARDPDDLDHAPEPRDG